MEETNHGVDRRRTLRTWHVPGAGALCLSLLVVVLWAGVTGRWTSGHWLTPASPPAGDILEVEARVQAAADAPFFPWGGASTTENLGAPIGADWSNYPSGDKMLFWIVGLLSRLTGVHAAIEISILGGFLANALSFFGCTRLLRWPRIWSVTGALVFAFASYNMRWAGTLSFGLTFAFPPLFLLMGWIARRAPAPRTQPWYAIALATGVAIGCGNPYFVFLGGQLAAFAVIAQLFREAHRRRLIGGGLLLASMTLAAVWNQLPYIVAKLNGAEEAATPMRFYHESEQYALRPIELFLPVEGHRWEWANQLARTYRERSIFEGEIWTAALGIVGVLCLLILVIVTAVRVLRSQRTRPIPDATLAVFWTVAVALTGGVNSMLFLAGLAMFRGTGRFSVFILTAAVMFGLGWLQRQTRMLPRSGAVLAIVLAIVALIDLPPTPNRAQGAESVQRDIDTVAEIASAVDGPVSMLQLPAVPFPERGVWYRMPDYEHFRPWLVDSKIRLSYGGVWGSLSDRWTAHLALLPAPQMIAAAEKAGMNVLWIDRRGFGDQAAALIGAVEKFRTRVPLPHAPHIAAFLLTPAAEPETPDPDALVWYQPFSGIFGDRIVAIRGWWGSERNPQHARWAGNKAAIGIQSMDAPRPQMIQFTVSAMFPGTLLIRAAGEVLWTGSVSAVAQGVLIPLPPMPAEGLRIDFDFDGRLRSTFEDPRPLGFKVTNLRLEASNP